MTSAKPLDLIAALVGPTRLGETRGSLFDQVAEALARGLGAQAPVVAPDEARAEAAAQEREDEIRERFEGFKDRWAETADVVLGTMTPRDIKTLTRDAAAADCGQWSAITRRFLWLCDHKVLWARDVHDPMYWPAPKPPYDRPLALPPEVCDVLEADPRSEFGSVDCAVCGYEIPRPSPQLLQAAYRATGRTWSGVAAYLGECPLCGSLEIGYGAYAAHRAGDGYFLRASVVDVLELAEQIEIGESVDVRE